MGIVLSVPWRRSSEFEHHTIVALLAGNSLVTLSRKTIDIQQAAVSTLSPVEASDVRFSERMFLALLKLTVSGNAAVVGELERQLRALEESPVPNNQANFFEHTFRLRKQLAAARSDLWRLKGVLLALVQGRSGIDAVKEKGGQLLQTLTDETEYLHETIESLREALLSIIELHLNVASFEMNKVMRILAVASVLGLVPAVVGGLFGMNIEGNPWPLTLPQVTFGVSIGMLLCLYVFFAKGWLR